MPLFYHFHLFFCARAERRVYRRGWPLERDEVSCSPHTEGPSGKLRPGRGVVGKGGDERELSAAGHRGDGLVFPVPLGRYGSLLSKGRAATRSKERGAIAPLPCRCAGVLQRGGGSCSVLAALLGKGALPIKETAFAARGWHAGRRRLWWVTGRGEISGWRAVRPPPVKRGRPVRGGAPLPAGAGR